MTPELVKKVLQASHSAQEELLEEKIEKGDMMSAGFHAYADMQVRLIAKQLGIELEDKP